MDLYSRRTWETKEDMEKICRRGNRRKRKDLERGEEVGKRQNKMQKLHISPVLRKELQEMMDGYANYKTAASFRSASFWIVHNVACRLVARQRPLDKQKYNSSY
jgi:hypothetical protein